MPLEDKGPFILHAQFRATADELAPGGSRASTVMVLP